MIILQQYQQMAYLSRPRNLPNKSNSPNHQKDSLKLRQKYLVNYQLKQLIIN